jgi:hypothetical protein
MDEIYKQLTAISLAAFSNLIVVSPSLQEMFIVGYEDSLHIYKMLWESNIKF